MIGANCTQCGNYVLLPIEIGIEGDVDGLPDGVKFDPEIQFYCEKCGPEVAGKGRELTNQ